MDKNDIKQIYSSSRKITDRTISSTALHKCGINIKMCKTKVFHEYNILEIPFKLATNHLVGRFLFSLKQYLMFWPTLKKTLCDRKWRNAYDPEPFSWRKQYAAHMLFCSRQSKSGLLTWQWIELNREGCS